MGKALGRCTAPPRAGGFQNPENEPGERRMAQRATGFPARAPAAAAAPKKLLRVMFMPSFYHHRFGSQVRLADGRERVPPARAVIVIYYRT